MGAYKDKNGTQFASARYKNWAGEILIWTKEEYRQFSAVIKYRPASFIAFEILYWCGLRLGELLALTPIDFDFEKSILVITKSYQRIGGKDIITPPKTDKSIRRVLLPDFLSEESQQYLSGLEDAAKDKRIFPFTKIVTALASDGGSSTEPAETITSEETLNEESVENTKLFSIVVTKTEYAGGDEIGKPLGGATIGLYDSEEHAKLGGSTVGEGGLINKVVTGDDGQAIFDNLLFSDSPVTYYVREIEQPEGYDLNKEVYPVEVSYDSENNKTVFTIENDDKDGILENDRLGTLTIHKMGTWKGIDDTSQEDIDLEGVQFSLYKVDASETIITLTRSRLMLLQRMRMESPRAKGFPKAGMNLLKRECLKISSKRRQQTRTAESFGVI